MAPVSTFAVLGLLVALSWQSVASAGNPARPASAGRRTGNVCPAATGRVQCHAKVLLATEYNGDTPEGAAALNLAFHPDAASMGPLNEPGIVPAPANGRHLLTASVYYKPAQLQQVYLNAKPAPKCQTVAVVGAFAYPKAQADLNFYRSYFSLPARTVTMYDQNGNTLQTTNPSGTGYVPSDSGWAMEQMLDLSMVSAICPCCPIMYVGSKSASPSDMFAAIKTAVNKGARVVSMSWGMVEWSGLTDTVDHGYFRWTSVATGVAFVASSGDAGYTGVNYPASSAYVTAVGGTSLRLESNNHRSTETVWAGAGSGCSSRITRPSWQPSTRCSKRTVADVAAVADPQTGVTIYKNGAWIVVGGTSAAAPIIAAMYGGGYLGTSGLGQPAQELYPGYLDRAKLYDVTTGATGTCGSYLCAAATGYDGPTGNGSPNYQ